MDGEAGVSHLEGLKSNKAQLACERSLPIDNLDLTLRIVLQWGLHQNVYCSLLVVKPKQKLLR